MARSRIVNLANFDQFTAINLLSDPGAIGGPKVVPQVAQLDLNWALDDGKVAHVLIHGRYAGSFALTAADATAIWTSLSTGTAWTALAAFLGSTTNFGAVVIRDLNVPGAPLIPSGGSGSAPGTSASPSLPNETAVVITKRTAATGRSNRGRMYIPGWATNALGSTNTVAAAAVTALTNWAATIQGALSARGLTMVIAQPARAQYTGSTGTVHPARAATSIAVTSLQVRDNHWDSQRRRGLK